MSRDKISHESSLVELPRRVRYTGSDALVKGQGLCYDADRGTAADADPKRVHYVEKPSATNNLWFAGVCSQDYTAETGGRWITIFEPGSTVYVAAGIDTTIDVTMLSCVAGSADPGRWREGGFMGRGTAIALQTITTGQIAGETDGTGVLDATGLILTGAGFSTGGVVAGDKVVIYGSENDGTNAGTDGTYTVASVTNNTTLVLTEAASDGGTMQCSYYIYSGNPQVLAHLYDGEESGLVEFRQITSGADTPMVGGVTYYRGYGNPDADTTVALANGKYLGLKKAFILTNAMIANDIVVTPATAGMQADGATALAAAEFDGALDALYLINMGVWIELYSPGVALS